MSIVGLEIKVGIYNPCIAKYICIIISIKVDEPDPWQLSTELGQLMSAARVLAQTLDRMLLMILFLETANNTF